MKLGMISSKTLSNDKRKKFYFIEWKFIVNKIKNPDEDIYDIINNLNLSDYTGKHVLLNKFEVIDSDTNLNKLILRHWDKTPSDDYVYLSIGTTRDVLTIDHEIE
ncbi:MAG: hypothetical protein HeimC3_48230 [Candidatus Heimdallarchaeota archaeon LC_3]|nr:MAG: hypothetical protein HeimC3_48230 [Candidatus Heimdallarchaeota archaeon LC_3]